MKSLRIVLAAACLAFAGATPNASAETDDSAVIATMEGMVEYIDAENGQIVVADSTYSVPKTVPIRRAGSRYIGLEHLRLGDRVVLHMPPGQHWTMPMPVAEIEVVQKR